MGLLRLGRKYTAFFRHFLFLLVMNGSTCRCWWCSEACAEYFFLVGHLTLDSLGRYDLSRIYIFFIFCAERGQVPCSSIGWERNRSGTVRRGDGLVVCSGAVRRNERLRVCVWW